MIVDHIGQANRYAKLNPHFRAAFAFLRSRRWASWEPGRHRIPGTKLYANVVSGRGVGRAKAGLEVHRRFIDLQYVVSGEELIGWRSAASCAPAGLKVDPKTDAALPPERPEAWVAVPPGCFAVFFPADPHAPMASRARMRKIIVKVPVR